MKEEEIIWYEENWNRHKTGRKAESHRRVWKLTNDIWDETFEGGRSNMSFRNCKCWKKKRKTHYLIKPVLVEKIRKPKEKEHWRYKKICHTTLYYNLVYHRMRKQKLYYSRDEFYSALGFMENLKLNDIIVWKDGYYGDGRGKQYKVRGKGYSNWGDRDSLNIKCEVIEKYNPYLFTERKIIDIWEFLKYYKQKVA